MELTYNSLKNDAALKAYYRMEPGLLTVDSKGAYTLTNNNVVADGGGKFGGASDFGTSNSNKTLLRLDNLGITTKVVSLSCWVKLNTEIGSGGYRFMNYQNDEQNWGIAIAYEYNSGTRRLNFMTTQAGIGNQSNYYTITLGTSNWYHLVITSDGTNQRAYLNGTLVGGPTAIRTSGNNCQSCLSIGSDAEGYPTIGSYSSCLMDDIAVFSKSLSDAEVLSIFTAEKEKFFQMF